MVMLLCCTLWSLMRLFSASVKNRRGAFWRAASGMLARHLVVLLVELEHHLHRPITRRRRVELNLLIKVGYMCFN